MRRWNYDRKGNDVLTCHEQDSFVTGEYLEYPTEHGEFLTIRPRPRRDAWAALSDQSSGISFINQTRGSGKTGYWWRKLSTAAGDKWAVPSLASVVIFDDSAIAARFSPKRQAFLDLEDDWNGEGSPGHSVTDWETVEGFLVRHARWFVMAKGLELPLPAIQPVGNATVDLHWKEARFELLINVPLSGDTASFYGDDYGVETIKGTFKASSTNTGLMEWIGSRFELGARANPK